MIFEKSFQKIFVCWRNRMCKTIEAHTSFQKPQKIPKYLKICAISSAFWKKKVFWKFLKFAEQSQQNSETTPIDIADWQPNLHSLHTNATSCTHALAHTHHTHAVPRFSSCIDVYSPYNQVANPKCPKNWRRKKLVEKIYATRTLIGSRPETSVEPSRFAKRCRGPFWPIHIDSATFATAFRCLFGFGFWFNTSATVRCRLRRNWAQQGRPPVLGRTVRNEIPAGLHSSPSLAL